MLLKPVPLEEVLKSKRKLYSHLIKEVLSFYESDLAAVEVDVAAYKSVNAARGAVSGALYRAQIASIRVIVRDGRLFMVKKAALEQLTK